MLDFAGFQRARCTIPHIGGTGNKRRTAHGLKAAVIREVIRLEKEVWKVAQQRDAAAFVRLVPADAVMIFQSGVISQPEYLRTMGDRTISRYRLKNIRGFMAGPATVILIYEALRVGRFKAKEFPSGRVMESTTWVKRGKKWVAVLNQETPIRQQDEH